LIWRFRYPGCFPGVIRHARELGFDIEAIRALLVMTAVSQASCDRADSIAHQHLDQVEHRIISSNRARIEPYRFSASLTDA
jgi:DNA-binding transcriptional MerR regulator